MPLIGSTDTTTATGAAAKTETPKKASGASGALGGMGSDAFMKLLVAQMRYQNPMAPTDGTQYLAQISQYAMVEQMQKVNEGQQEISSYQRALIANAMIGKLVAGVGETGAVISGTVLGVDFQSGKPMLVTTGGDLAVDKVDEARLPVSTGAAAAANAAAANAATNTAATNTAATNTAATNTTSAATTAAAAESSTQPSTQTS